MILYDLYAQVDDRFRGAEAEEERKELLDELTLKLEQGASIRLLCWCCPRRYDAMLQLYSCSFVFKRKPASPDDL